MSVPEVWVSTEDSCEYDDLVLAGGHLLELVDLAVTLRLTHVQDAGPAGLPGQVTRGALRHVHLVVR